MEPCVEVPWAGVPCRCVFVVGGLKAWSIDIMAARFVSIFSNFWVTETDMPWSSFSMVDIRPLTMNLVVVERVEAVALEPEVLSISMGRVSDFLAFLDLREDSSSESESVWVAAEALLRLLAMVETSSS